MVMATDLSCCARSSVVTWSCPRFGQKVGVCDWTAISSNPVSRWGRLPEGERWLPEEPQLVGAEPGPVRHTQKTDGQILRPGNCGLWSALLERGKECPPTSGSRGSVCWHGPGAPNHPEAASVHGSCTQEGDGPLKHSGCSSAPARGALAPTHPAAALQVTRQEWAPAPLQDARDLNRGHTPPQRGPGPSLPSTYALP